MKMSRSNAQKLSGLLWRQRLRKIGIGAGVILGLAGLLITFNNLRVARSDPIVIVTPVTATVSRHDTTRSGRTGFLFHANVADGHEVDAIAPNGFAPPVGTTVVLGEAKHKSGRLSYDFIRLKE